MALEPAEVEVPFGGGLDTKSNRDLQDPASATQLDDLRWDRLGEYAKRPGHNESLSCDISGTSDYSSPSPATHASTVFVRGGEVCALTDQWGVARRTQYVDGSLSDAVAMRPVAERALVAEAEDDAYCWAPVPVEVRREFLESAQTAGLSGTEEVGLVSTASAVCTVGTRTILVYGYVTVYGDGTAGRLRVRAVDTGTWGVVRESESINLAGSTATAVTLSACALSEANAEGVLITYSDGTAAPVTIAGIRYDARTNDFATVPALTTNATVLGQHSVVQSGTSFLFGYDDNTTGLGVVETRTISGGIAATHLSTNAFNFAPAIVVGPTQTLIAYTDATTGLLAETLGNPASVITLQTLGAGLIVRVAAAAETRSSFTHAAIVYAQVNIAGSQIADGVVYGLCDFSSAAVVDHWTVNEIPDAQLIGAFTARGRAHCIVQTEAGVLQSAGAVLSSGLVLRTTVPNDGGSYANARTECVARVMHERLPSSPAFFGMAVHASVTGDIVRFVLPADLTVDKQSYNTTAGVALPTAVAALQLDFGPKPVPTAEIPGMTLIGGGMLHGYDGGHAFEMAFPSTPKVEASTNGVGSITATVKCAAVWTFQDDAGRVHRSRPGFAADLAASANRVDVEVSMPPVASRDGVTRRRHGVELYIQASDGLYRLANNANSQQDVYDALGGTFGFTVLFNDISIPTTGEPPLYSDGTATAELVSEPSPATHSIAVVANRVWCIDSEDRTAIWFSKPLEPTLAPEFHGTNVIHIGDEGVGVVDVAGVPTVLGADGIWQIYGAGPNALGVGTFAEPRRLPHRVECLDPRSVCRTPMGVLFRGRRGVYLLGNDLSLQPIGTAVDAEMYRSGVVNGHCRIAYDELSNEAHVLDFDGSHYVLNLAEAKWARWTQDSADDNWTDIAVADGRVWYLHQGSDNVVYLRDMQPLDNASASSTTRTWAVRTPWLRLDGVNGLARVREVQVAVRLPGTVANSGSIQVTYEARDGTSNTVTWTAAQLGELGVAGEVVTLRARPAQQVAPACRITVQELTPAGSTTGTIPVALRLRGGVRRTNRRQASSQVQGSST